MSPRHWSEVPYFLVSTPSDPEPNKLPDEFDRLTSDMVLIHNALIRGINSITQQAQHVKPADRLDFLAYCKLWHDLFEAYHAAEEKFMIAPVLFASSGNELNNQRARWNRSEFIGPIRAFSIFISVCLAVPTEFDDTRLTDIIDDFGSVLARHFQDEVDLLAAMKKRFEGQPQHPIMVELVKDWKSEMKAALGNIGISRGCIIIGCHDVTWEGGRWSRFPGVIRRCLVLIYCWWSGAYNT